MLNSLKLSSILLVFLTASAWGQYKESIQSDRPGQTYTPLTLGKNVFQHQSGFNFSFLESNLAWGMGFYNQFRLGLTERVELDAELDTRYDKYNLPFSTASFSGVSNTALGLRYNIIDSYDWWMPSLGVRTMMLFTAQSEDYRRNNLGFGALLATSNQLLDWLSFNMNWGVQYTGNSAEPLIPYTLNVGFSIADRWSAFIEHYAEIRFWTLGFDIGGAFLITDDILVDLSLGTPDLNGFPSWFVEFGVSWRLDWRSDVSMKD